MYNEYGWHGTITMIFITYIIMSSMHFAAVENSSRRDDDSAMMAADEGET